MKAVKHVKAVVFDWGDTLMRVFKSPGPMAYWPHVALVPGVAGALEQLAGQVVLCVASNAGDSDAELMGLALARVGIRKYLDYLLTSRELGANKPQPAFFRGVIRALMVEPGECVMVGDDYERDIASAKAIGMHTVWFAEAPVAGPNPAADVVICSMANVVTAVAQAANGT